jgi:hypothetical protein
MRPFALRIELDRLMSVDRLHHADPGELHRAAILRGLGDAMRGALNLVCSDCGISFASDAIACFSLNTFLLFNVQILLAE